MEDILARYIDGELTEAEAAELLRRSAQDPELDRALRDHEAIVACADDLPPLDAPPHLADGVMTAVERQEAASAPRSGAGWPWLAVAAALLLGVGIGLLAGQSRVSDRTRVVDRPTARLMPAVSSPDSSPVSNT